MRWWRWALLAAAFSGLPAVAQTVADQDAAVRAARDAYRGHQVFAVASYSPFATRRWFTLSFFNYWTGYTEQGTSKAHWLVKRIAGQHEGVDANGSDVAAVPGRTMWADSATCPALEQAAARFRLNEASGFAGSETPPTRPPDPATDRVIVSSYDASFISFWARLAGKQRIEVQISGETTSGVAKWVLQTAKAIDGCFRDAPPDIAAAQPHDIAGNRPVDMFAGSDLEAAE